MTSATTTMTTMSRAASMLLIPFLSHGIRRRLFISRSYLEPVHPNWLLRVVTRVTVYDRPDANVNVAPLQLGGLVLRHAVLIAMLTWPTPFGLIEVGYFPAASVGQLSRAY